MIGVLTMCVSSEKIHSEIFLLSGGRLGFFLLWLLFLLGLLGLFLLLVVLGRGRGSRCTNWNLSEALLDNFIDVAAVEWGKDCIDLCLIDGLAGSLEDGDKGVLGFVNGDVLGALPEREARARAETYCIWWILNIIIQLIIIYWSRTRYWKLVNQLVTDSSSGHL